MPAIPRKNYMLETSTTLGDLDFSARLLSVIFMDFIMAAKYC